MREFRFLDEKRKTNGLTPAEEQRWHELAGALGMDAPQPQQGYYGPDGQWYPYPEGYDPNAQWQQQPGQWDPNAPPQGYYGADGQWYAYPEGYDPNAQGYGYGAYPQQQPQYPPQQQPYYPQGQHT